MMLSERFLSKIEVGDCWRWTGSINGGKNGGYGNFRVGGKVVKAHRYAWERLVGPIPEGMITDHLCLNRACVNPDHIEIVTRGENTRRSWVVPAAKNARKTHCQNGHILSDENLRMEGKSRRCVPCYRKYQREYQREYQQKKRARA